MRGADSLPIEAWQDRKGTKYAVRAVRTVAHADAIAEIIAEHAADWAPNVVENGRVDWEDWCERFEADGYALPEQWDDPAMRRVKRIARAAMEEAGAFEG